MARKGRGGLCLIFKNRKSEFCRNSRGKPQDNQGSSGLQRAGERAGKSRSQLRPSPRGSRQKQDRRRTQIPAREDRDENRGQERRRMSGKRMKGSGTDRYTAVGAHRGGDAGLGRHGPYTAPGSRIPSRPTLTPQSSPRSDIK